MHWENLLITRTADSNHIICSSIKINFYSNDDEGKVLLRKLARINKPLEIGFSDMLKLMQQCNKVDKQRDISKRKASKYEPLYERNSDLGEESSIHNEALVQDEPTENRGILSGNPFSLLSGVFPGTRWCGTGDVARNFHDLGEVGFLFKFALFIFYLLMRLSGKGDGSLLQGSRHLPSEGPSLSITLQSHK